MRGPRHGRQPPRALRAQRAHVERIAVEILDRAATAGASGECDFVERIAAPLPLAVIAWILGVPRPDWELLFRWTNEVIGKDDPEYRRPDETPGQTIKRARAELHAYFERLIERRRSEPQDDLVSELVRATIDGTPLTQEQLLSYCELMVEAGNETTRNAISGGLLAFCEHRGEWEKLRGRPELLSGAVEEILRWVSLITHFTRTATEDCEVRGATIRAGEQVALFWASANRDEEVFADPFAFRVDRRPNPHLATGGRRPAHLDRGYFIEPTVFADVDNGSTIARDEIFGPVMSVIPADSEEQAIEIANETIYGHNSSVFTNDPERAYAVGRRIRAGTVGRNAFKTDFSISFGGFKQSGIGREGGTEGMHPYLEAKTIILDQPAPKAR